MEKLVCIHGHFYQPPRENAWLEYIEMQDSAYPYHDWNERVSNECYAPNTASRILDSEGLIGRIVSNYSKISFNFGPTLLSWMEDKDNETYRAVLEADKKSLEAYSGHGSAIAQAYNHIIMPLANRRDKYTQVVWGIRDFEHRFGRQPEGMWLPETAVDVETLDIMAEQGIKFVILAPHQAGRTRRIGSEEWTASENGGIDTRVPYRVNLPSGRNIVAFFYNGSLAQDVAFGDILQNGERFAGRLAEVFKDFEFGPPAQLSHIATDGETYGHHHRFGDMALAYAADYLESRGLARMTNYAEFLEKYPPAMEAEILEKTSWSCEHGIERWRADCGCNAGRNSRWNQKWRAPLRESMDWLRDTLAGKYEQTAAAFLKDPWAARDDYIRIILDRSPETVADFMNAHQAHPLDEAERVSALKLLELQRHAMLMFTSCGWFFDELSGLETVQIIQYAGRAIQLAKEVMGDDVEARFLEMLSKARSNLRSQGNGQRIYENHVRPAMVDLTRVTAHFAVSSLFEEYEKEAQIFCYRMAIEDYRTSTAGTARLAVGKVRATSGITGESGLFTFGVMHLGDHNVNAGTRDYQGEEQYNLTREAMEHAFSFADFPEVIRALDKHFGISTYSIKDLFLDEQRKVLDSILESAMKDIEAAYYNVYRHHYPPMRFLMELGYPIPKSFQTTAEFILNGGLRRTISSETFNLEETRELLEETRTWNVELDNEGLGHLARRTLETMMGNLAAAPDDTGLLERLLTATELLHLLPFPLDLWKVQNLFYNTMLAVFPGYRQRAEQGDKAADDWLARFRSLGQKLSMRVG